MFMFMFMFIRSTLPPLISDTLVTGLEMRGGVTDAGQTNNKRQTITEDRATQPMEAGG